MTRLFHGVSGFFYLLASAAAWLSSPLWFAIFIAAAGAAALVASKGARQ